MWVNYYSIGINYSCLFTSDIFEIYMQFIVFTVLEIAVRIISSTWFIISNTPYIKINYWYFSIQNTWEKFGVFIFIFLQTKETCLIHPLTLMPKWDSGKWYWLIIPNPSDSWAIIITFHLIEHVWTEIVDKLQLVDFTADLEFT